MQTVQNIQLRSTSWSSGPQHLAGLHIHVKKVSVSPQTAETIMPIKAILEFVSFFA